MRAGAHAIALASSCFLFLAGCGGGGGSSVPTPSGASTATNTSATTPAPTPTPVPPLYPRAAGDTFAYSGQLQQAFQSFPEIVAPGTPSPEPVATTTVNVAQTVTVSTNQTYNGTSGLVGLHVAETDTQTSGLKTTTSTTDTYESLVQVGALTQLLSYGAQFADEGGDTTSTLYAPPLVLDQIPQTPGASWSNGPSATVDEAVAGDATGSPITVVRTTNADGSYTEKTTYPPNFAAPGITGVGQIQENTDGSGTFSFVANGSTISITYSPPEPQPSGPPLITVNEYAGTDTTVKPSSTFQIPTWFGNAPALYGETDQDQGVVTIPASCNLQKAFPGHATALAQTITRTDTILGYTEAQTTTSYVAAGYGVLCTVATDKQTLYYDFNGDQRFAFTATPPLEITTVSETLTMEPSPLINASSQRATRGASAPSAPVFGMSAALHANFERVVRAAHRRRAAQLLHAAAAHLHLTGGAL